jgi:hypothetical protein
MGIMNVQEPGKEISELEDRTIEIIQSEQHIEKY